MTGWIYDAVILQVFDAILASVHLCLCITSNFIADVPRDRILLVVLHNTMVIFSTENFVGSRMVVIGYEISWAIFEIIKNVPMKF